jgi:hypothetical protein
MWDGNQEFMFPICGILDPDFSKDSETRKSESGNSNVRSCVENRLFNAVYNMQIVVVISVTKSELRVCCDDQCTRHAVHKTNCNQSHWDCMCNCLPMILEVDNKGAVDLVNNYIQCGRENSACRKRQIFSRQLKEEGIIKVSLSGRRAS